MATEGRVLVPADAAGGNPVRTVVQSTQANDEGAPSNKDAQVFALTDPTTPANMAAVDNAGRLNALTRVASLTITSGTITTATGTVVAITDIANAGAVTAVIAGTYAGVSVVFEASLDGTNWVGVIGQRTDAYQVETGSGVLAANTIRAWDFPLPGFTEFRVRATAWTSGSASVFIAPAVNAFEIAPSVGIAGTANAPVQTSVAIAAASFTALAANPSRRGASFYNDSSTTLYLLTTGGTASTTAHTVQMQPGGYFELPNPVYNGLITAIGATATGSVRVTEYT